MPPFFIFFRSWQDKKSSVLYESQKATNKRSKSQKNKRS